MPSPNDIPAMREKQWKPGQSGNPKGRPPMRSLESCVTELLRQEIDDTGKQRIEIVAARLVKQLFDGDHATLKVMLDRLWPAENRHTISGDKDNPLRTESTVLEIVPGDYDPEERDMVLRIAHKRLQGAS